jgi:TPR repeat protein
VGYPTALIYLAVALFVVALLWPWSRDVGRLEGALEAVAREDWAAAVSAWRPLAESGYPPAQYNLALLYERGQGVARDPSTAAHWYRLAAEQDVLLAKVNLALLYISGDGVARDYGRALVLLEEAAAAGNGKAQTNLGNLHLRGLGVARDEAAAAKLFRAAAQQDNQVAQVRIGQCYRLGQGVRVDYREAFAWLSLAARRGNAMGKFAGHISESLLARMDPQQRSDARRRAGALSQSVPSRRPTATAQFAQP